MYKRIIAAFLMLALCLSVMSACSFAKSDEELIEARINKFVTSFNAGDLDAVAECLDAKTRTAFKSAMNIADALLGTTGVAVSLTDMFGLAAGILIDGDIISVSDMKVTITDETSATVDCLFGYMDKSADAKEQVFFTMVKEEDDWFIKNLEGKRGPDDDKVQQYLESADDYYDNKDYLSALQMYEAALELKEDSEEAANGLAKAKEAYKKSVLQQADDYIASKDYNNAERVLNGGLSQFPDDSEIENRLSAIQEYRKQDAIIDALKVAEDRMINQDYIGAMKQYEAILATYSDSKEAADGLSKAKTAYRQTVLNDANAFINDRDYNSAEKALKQGLKNLPDDTELTKLLNGMEDVKIKDIVDDAYLCTEGGDWDGAVQMLEKAQEQYKNNSTIINAYNDIKEKMPYTLKNITTVSSDNIKVIKDVVKDRYDNIYDGAVYFSAKQYREAYSLYNLSKKFKTFKAFAFVGRDASNRANMSIAVYADEKLVFFEDEITEETPPISIEVDVTNATTLRIVVKCAGSWENMYFGNSSFEKKE